MEQKINFIFEGNVEVLNAVSKGDPIVKLLGFPNPSKCPLIGSEIQLLDKIGEGKFGQVFLIDVPGKGAKKYVVKKGKVSAELYHKEGPIDEDNAIEETEVSLDTLKAFNPYVNFNLSGKLLIYVPKFAQECLIEEDMEFPALPEFQDETGGERVIVPAGSYLCSDKSFSEFYIGAMVGEAYRKEECINFFDVYSMFTCLSDDQSTKVAKIYNQFIFMDKLSGEYSNFNRCNHAAKFLKSIPKAEKRLSQNRNKYLKNKTEYEKSIRDAIYFQLIFAIAFYQERYDLSHNDLHEKNMFIECIDETTMFNSELLHDAEWFHYSVRVDNKGTRRDIYFPKMDVILKIGDFGLSVKYSHPMVGDLEIFD